MSEKQRNEPPVKLTRAEKREIQAIIRKYKGDGKAHSAQASIPYQAMYPDGICRVTANTFSKCIEFADISYQLAQADTKTAIFENLCDLYNYLDASIHVQFSFVNRKTDPKQYAKSFEIKAQGDDFDDIRAEYSGILQDQLVRGNNGLTKRKFLTFTIEADNLKMARTRLTRIETDLLGYFKTMGAVAHVLDAKERLEVLHGVLHPDAEPFQFEWKWLAPSGLSTKDFIAPSSFRFGNSRMFGLGGKYGAVSFLNILSPELSDEMLADFLNTENGIVVNLHVQAIDQSEAIKTVKRKITDLDAMKIQEQKRAVRSGYDMDILPSDLATYGQDAKELLKTLQSRNERMFQITFLVMNTADTRQKLENDVFWAAGVAQKYNCSLVRLDYQQEQGLMSSLPLGANHIKIERSLTTSSVAVFVPFVTQELFMGGDAMYYGVNAKTGNMIILDRKRARCPNGLKLGTPGSGKSMIARRIPTIMPPMSEEEQMEVTRIYSIAGMLAKGEGVRRERPFRAPHHTMTPQALAGGGKQPSPGEITLAHRGVLFLDELPEMTRTTIEILRQPLEEHRIVISRVSGNYVFPASFLMVAAMNPCPCGFYPDLSRCTCAPGDISRYLSRVSQPFLDRMDLCVQVEALSYEDLHGEERCESSAKMREKATAAAEIQAARYRQESIHFNSELKACQSEKYCILEKAAEELLEDAFRRLRLSARSYHGIIRTARTIADLDGAVKIGVPHISEAICFRSADKSIWRI